MKESGGWGDRCFSVFPKPSIEAEPSEGSFDNPAPRLHGKADLASLWSYDLDRHWTGPANSFTLIASIGEDARDDWEAVTRRAGEFTGTITILHRRCANDDREQPVVGIDQGMALATDDCEHACNCVPLGGVFRVEC